MNSSEQMDVKKKRNDDPAHERGPELGNEERADEVTSANLALERALEEGGGSEPGPDQIDDQRQDSDHSIDERMPVGSESPEDKAQDVINSGILRM